MTMMQTSGWHSMQDKIRGIKVEETRKINQETQNLIQSYFRKNTQELLAKAIISLDKNSNKKNRYFVKSII